MLLLLAGASLTPTGTGPGDALAVPTVPVGDTWIEPVGIAVVVPPAPLGSSDRFATEAAAHAVLALEAQLADLAGVVPRLQGLSPGVDLAPHPGLSDPTLSGDPTLWTLGPVVRVHADTLTLTASWCAESGDCETLSAHGDPRQPQAVAARITEVVAEALDRPTAVSPWVWASAESDDPYAQLVAGRSAATVLGWHPLEAGVRRGDARRDPVGRAVLIDPAQPTAWSWLGRWVRDDPAQGHLAWRQAVRFGPEHPVAWAARARSLSARGLHDRAWAAWQEVAMRAPADRRFALSRALAAEAAGAHDAARALLVRLGHRFHHLPEVAALRVRLAEAEGPVPDAALAAWQAADPTATEPVRRRIAARVAAGRYEEALALTDSLARRGDADEAHRLVVALATDRGRYEEAATAARALGQHDVARRLAAQAARTSATDQLEALVAADGPSARLARANALLALGRADEATEELQWVLDADPWWPEALHLLARARASLGDEDGADAARSRLRHADPAYAGGEATP